MLPKMVTKWEQNGNMLLKIVTNDYQVITWYQKW